MQSLPDALAPLAAYKQFILWMLADRDGKQVKLPVDHRTASVGDAHNPELWLDSVTALATAEMYGPEYGIGFVFTAADPFFFVDLDKCLEPDGASWSPVAMDIMGRLPGAAIEVSQSARGLHIFGKGFVPDHSCKNVPLGLELYTEGRFVALTGTSAIGSASVDCTASLASLVDTYFPPKTATKDQGWTTTPVEGSTPPESDDDLIAKAMLSGSASNAFGGKAGFKDLWECNVAVLAANYPDDEGGRDYDGSSADAALAQHLAFWTGNNCERIERLMWLSGLVREKWTIHKRYVGMTVTRAVSLQSSFYTGGVAAVNEEGAALAEQYVAPTLRGSDKQKVYGGAIRAEKLALVAGDVTTIEALCSGRAGSEKANFWIEYKDHTPAEIAAAMAPVQPVVRAGAMLDGPKRREGWQFLSIDGQIELFKGCIYVQDCHKVFTPDGMLLKPDQFKATYGGYVFQLEDNASGKTTKNAWEAFTESQGVQYPIANAFCFRPALASGALIEEEGRVLVNSYIPIMVDQTPGDVGPFLDHLRRVLPIEGDRAILVAFMAACVQHKGHKFQWAPLIQGAEGNGKTLFTRCVAAAIGLRYTHMPPASEIAEKFNEWLFRKLFIGVEDIYVPDHKKEVLEILKPMITNSQLAMRAMQASQVMGDNFANFILNSNHKDAVRKTKNDRRFCIFYTAQQSADDVKRDGMGGDYFPNLYNWLKAGGYAHVANYLATYAIPDALNPAGACHRAPDTSSTEEAVTASMGGVEQEILEAIDEGRQGFAGGWVSSMAVERLLDSLRMGRAIPHNKRRELMQGLGYDWHPALLKTNGRVNNVVALDGGKPRLFIKCGHIHANLESAAEVARQYQEAQGQPVGASAAAAFGA